MKQEIKERIEQINNGIVPEGYKKTKIGIMPIDWDIADLGHLISESKELSNDINKYKVFSSSRNGLIPQNDYYNKESVETNNGYKIVPNGFVTYRHMSDDDVFHFNVNTTGASVLVSSEYPVFCSTENSCLGFLVPCLNHSARFRYYCKLQKKGGTRTRLYYNILCKYTIAHPKIEEQEKIAEILSTQDKVIELKEKLIEQKRLQKDYFVEQLVTGKASSDNDNLWFSVKLRDVLTERNTYANKNSNIEHVTLSTEGIYAKSERYDREHLVKKEDKEYKVTKKGDICYNPANLKFGVICVNDFGTAIFSPIYVTFEINEGYDLDFISAYLMRWNFINAVRKYEEGTVYERMAVKPSDFLNFEIFVPNLEEQKRIAKLISVLNNELKLLQQELEQEKQKKKALMQLLLTGIVRVKND